MPSGAAAAVLPTVPLSPPSVPRWLSVALSLALAGGLLWLALRGADLAAVGDALADGAWGWLAPYVLAGVASVAVRAWRWGLLIDALPGRDRRVGLGLTSAAVAIGYLVNYAVPRLGELARAAHVSRRTDAPLAGVVGTVVAERVLDVIALALALLSVAVFWGDRVRDLLTEAAANVGGMLAAPPVWALALGALALAAAVGLAAVLVRQRGRLAEAVASFRDGLASVGRTGRAGSVVVSTVALWACYGLMADLPLRLLGLSAEYGLSVADAWAVMAVGGIGMALPAPGGTGSFHYATVQALTLLFGIAVTPAATYALLVHAAGLMFYAALGGAALVAQGTSFASVTRAARQA